MITIAKSAALGAALAMLPAAGSGITPGETALMERIPADIRSRCVPVPAVAPASAVITCDLTATQGLTVTYEGFTTHADASSRYTAAVDAGITGEAIPDGDCRTGAGPAENAFARDDVAAGRAACWTGENGATVVWLSTDSGTVATATRQDGDLAALGGWWMSAGPDDRIGPVTHDMGGVYPDPYERRLLLDVRAGGAAVCARTSSIPRSEDGAQAVLACRARPAGVAILMRLANGALVHRVYRILLDTYGVRRGAGGSCTGARPTERAFRTSAGARGRFMCVVQGGRALLVWKHPQARLVGAVTGTDARFAPLRAWWRSNGRTIDAWEAGR